MPEPIRFSFDEALYPKDAVYGAAYVLIDRCWVHLDRPAEGRIEVTLRVKPGVTLGESDEFGFNAVKDRVHVHDLNATILHLLGFDHTRLTYRFQGRDFRLTDVYGNVVEDVLS